MALSHAKIIASTINALEIPLLSSRELAIQLLQFAQDSYNALVILIQIQASHPNGLCPSHISTSHIYSPLRSETNGH